MLALAALLWGAPRAVEAAVCGGSNTTCTSSTTRSSHVTIIGTGVGYLSLPSVLAALQKLQGSGQSPLTLTGTNTTVSTATSFGPATIFVGEDQSQTFFVAAGSTNVNINVHTASFFALNALSSSPAFAALLGDFHAAF